MLKTSVQLFGQTIEIEGEDELDLFGLVSHYQDINRKATGRHVKPIGWLKRVVDGDSYYEFTAMVDNKFAKLRVNQYKTPPDGLKTKIYVASSNRWIHYDSKLEQAYSFEQLGNETKWVPVERVKGEGYRYLEDGWWNSETPTEAPSKKPARKATKKKSTKKVRRRG